MERNRTRRKEWESPDFVQMTETHFDGFQLIVRFTNGDEIEQPVSELVSQAAGQIYPEQTRLELDGSILVMPGEQTDTQIFGLSLRMNTDLEFARHIIDQSAEQRKIFIGPAIKTLRESVGFTQRKLAQRLRTKESDISRIETGDHRNITYKTLNRVLAALGKDLPDFVAEISRLGYPNRSEENPD